MDEEYSESDFGTSDILRSLRTAMNDDFDPNQFRSGDENEVTVVNLMKDPEGFTCMVDNEREDQALNLSIKPDDIEATKRRDAADSPTLKIILPKFDANDDQAKDLTELGVANPRNIANQNGNNVTGLSAIENGYESTYAAIRSPNGYLQQNQNTQRSQSTQRINELSCSTLKGNKQRGTRSADMRLDFDYCESSLDIDGPTQFAENLRLPSASDLNKAIRVSGKVPALDMSPVVRPKRIAKRRSPAVRQPQAIQPKVEMKIIDVRTVGQDRVIKMTPTNQQPRQKNVQNQQNRAVSIVALPDGKQVGGGATLVATPVKNHSTVAKDSNKVSDMAEIPGLGPVATMSPNQNASKGRLQNLKLSVKGSPSSLARWPLQKVGSLQNPGPVQISSQPTVSIVHGKAEKATKQMISLQLDDAILPNQAKKSTSQSTLIPIMPNSSNQKPVFISKPFKLPQTENGTSQVFLVNVNGDGKIVAQPDTSKKNESVPLQQNQNCLSTPNKNPISMISSSNNRTAPITSFPGNNQKAPIMNFQTTTTKSGSSAAVKVKSSSSAATMSTPKSVIGVIFSAASDVIANKSTDSVGSMSSNTKVTSTKTKKEAPTVKEQNILVMPSVKRSGSPLEVLPNSSSSPPLPTRPIRDEPSYAIPGTSMPYRTPGSAKVNRHGNIKRPMNAFMVWARQHRPLLSASMDNATNAEISMRLGQIWKRMPESEKNKYYAEAERIKLMHKLTYPDWSYKPHLRRMANPSATPSPPGMIYRSPQPTPPRNGNQSEQYASGSIAREYALERHDGSTQPLKGRPPSITTRANDTGQSNPEKVLSETSMATLTLAGLNDVNLVVDHEAVDMSIGSNVELSVKPFDLMSEEEKRRHIREELESVKYEKLGPKRKLKPPPASPKPAKKQRENPPRSKNTQTKKRRDQSYSNAECQTETETDSVPTWPFPFSAYPLNDHYAERARLANAVNQPLMWNNAGASGSNSSLPDFDPYHPLLFENGQPPKVQKLNMQRWVDYMNRSEDGNFNAFVDGAKSESSTSLASCDQIVQNVMKSVDDDIQNDQNIQNDTKKQPRRSTKDTRTRSAQPQENYGDPGPPTARDILNAMYTSDDRPYSQAESQYEQETNLNWPTISPSGNIIIEPLDNDLAEYGSFADLGFCDLGDLNLNNSSSHDIPWWHYVPYFGGMGHFHPAVYRQYNVARRVVPNKFPARTVSKPPCLNVKEEIGGLRVEKTEVKRGKDEIDDESDGSGRRNDSTEEETKVKQERNVDRLTAIDGEKSSQKTEVAEKQEKVLNDDDHLDQHKDENNTGMTGHTAEGNEKSGEDRGKTLEDENSENGNDDFTESTDQDKPDECDDENDKNWEPKKRISGESPAHGRNTRRKSLVFKFGKKTWLQKFTSENVDEEVVREKLEVERKSLQEIDTNESTWKKKRGRGRPKKSEAAKLRKMNFKSKVKEVQKPARSRPTRNVKWKLEEEPKKDAETQSESDCNKAQSQVDTTQFAIPTESERDTAQSQLSTAQFVIPTLPRFHPRRIPMMLNQFVARYSNPVHYPPQAPRRSMMPFTSMPTRLRYIFGSANGQNEAIDLSAKNVMDLSVKN